EAEHKKVTKEGKPSAQQLLDLAEWALTHGLVADCEKMMEELAQAQADHPAAAAFAKVKAALEKKVSRDGGAAEWRRKLFDRDAIIAERKKQVFPRDANMADRLAAQTNALLLKALAEDGENAAVSYSGTRQLLVGSGLLAQNVELPLWVQSGMGSFFQT